MMEFIDVEIIPEKEVIYRKIKPGIIKRRLNEFVGKCEIRKAIKAENKKMGERILEKYLKHCMDRMYGRLR